MRRDRCDNMRYAYRQNTGDIIRFVDIWDLVTYIRENHESEMDDLLSDWLMDKDQGELVDLILDGYFTGDVDELVKDCIEESVEEYGNVPYMTDIVCEI